MTNIECPQEYVRDETIRNLPNRSPEITEDDMELINDFLNE